MFWVFSSFFLLWEYNFQWFLVGISVPPLFINFLLRRKHYFAFVLEKFNRFMWEQIIVLDLEMIENVSMPSIMLWSKFSVSRRSHGLLRVSFWEAVEQRNWEYTFWSQPDCHLLIVQSGTNQKPLKSTKNKTKQNPKKLQCSVRKKRTPRRNFYLPVQQRLGKAAQRIWWQSSTTITFKERLSQQLYSFQLNNQGLPGWC